METVNSVTPAATVMVPSLLSVTPGPNVIPVRSKSFSLAVPNATSKAKVVGVLEALLKVTVWIRLVPSSSLSSVTDSIVGVGSSFRIVPVPLAEPTFSVRVSSVSKIVSSTVGMVIVKLVTPAGTVIWPVAASYVTPEPKLIPARSMSFSLAVPSATLKSKVVEVTDELLKVIT